ncbi:DUF1854 domain-containing protein [Azospira restricta]|uniref:DUF1854 domain-containing protein n=1 Tax=Azospira restricta TaxID=404405 RepID=A0A974SRW2_9RHOO|nr:DUF1854 domain-containing protein [Azospira restricta]QRJ65336.1 DUF1854 domain-containing protein [Azospira restricta]
MSSANFRLIRNPFGRLVFTGADGTTHEAVVPVRAFPIGAPDDGIALVSVEGHELLWIDRLEQLPGDVAALIRGELESREFVPEIRRIRGVSSFACPSTWDIETDRGDAKLVLKGEEDIRRLGRERLLIADTHGIQYLVRDLTALDRGSRKILDRFL